LIFLPEATQDDHIRSLYELGTDKKKFGCVGSCGYVSASAKEVFSEISVLMYGLYSRAAYDGARTVHEIIIFIKHCFY
jgi:hypothetical protein